MIACASSYTGVFARLNVMIYVDLHPIQTGLMIVLKLIIIICYPFTKIFIFVTHLPVVNFRAPPKPLKHLVEGGPASTNKSNTGCNRECRAQRRAFSKTRPRDQSTRGNNAGPIIPSVYFSL